MTSEAQSILDEIYPYVDEREWAVLAKINRMFVATGRVQRVMQRHRKNADVLGPGCRMSEVDDIVPSDRAAVRALRALSTGLDERTWLLTARIFARSRVEGMMGRRDRINEPQETLADVGRDLLRPALDSCIDRDGFSPRRAQDIQSAAAKSTVPEVAAAMACRLIAWHVVMLLETWDRADRSNRMIGRNSVGPLLAPLTLAAVA